MKRFRVALAGCGGMSNTWVEYALSRDDVEIVALVDIKQENAQTLALNRGLTCNIYSDITKAIRSSGADLVFNVTTPSAHKDIVILALESGCDVFGEKPMAASMKEAREMVTAADKSGRMYAVMQNRRYNRNIRALKGLLDSGAIGDPAVVCADFFIGAHFGGFRDTMASPLILDMSIHTFDQARFITSLNPISVYCHEFNPSGSWYKGNAAAICIFELSNDSVFCYRGSWCAEGFLTSWDASWRVTGANGTAIWDGENVPCAEVAIPSDEGKFLNDFRRITAETSWSGREGHFGCLDEMFSALNEGRKAETDCTDNIGSMAMVFGALESARRRQRIHLKC